MRAVVQRVSQASVTVAGEVVGAIGPGLLVLLGIAHADDKGDAEALAEKIVHLRVFADEQGIMNRSLLETGGAALVVSQFTLLGDCRKGRRPAYSEAAAPAEAQPLYEHFCAHLTACGPRVATGVFRAAMEVQLVNHGPVTLLLDSRKLF
jgi:D-tyrosyl-tRNA(Tyr) deacylase